MEPNRNRPPLQMLPMEELPYALLLSDMPQGTENVDDLVVRSAIYVAKTAGSTDVEVSKKALLAYAGIGEAPAPSYNEAFSPPTVEQRREMCHAFFPEWDGSEPHDLGQLDAEDLGFDQEGFDRAARPAVFLGKPRVFGNTADASGECLFAALSFYLTGEPTNYVSVRTRLADYIRADPYSVPKHAMLNDLRGAGVAHSADEQLSSLANKYADLVEKPAHWGGDDLLPVFGKLAQCNVWVYVQAQDGTGGMGNHIESWQLFGEFKPGRPSVYLCHRPSKNHWSSVMEVRSY
ncbi:hypothetical protein BESB_049490 [Besnoitia besnoiti]|uniref:OTU domain-containing protein n=1 Tax=Besnoitia besnoiti TaxID=94643 RepID=A0A2A9MM13_BESBE|nr:hypothetical protein BESB_049490 [Besnoitia besnoiti]PFH36757.1 hypothetical protein BESB_049490 [Besnoitia besnoiti]